MLRALAIAMLRAYRLALSPLISAAGVRCRHWPSCSRYGEDAIHRHGLWAGGWMTLARLARCRPFGSSGYDPAPTTRQQRRIWAPWRYGDWAPTLRAFPSPAEPLGTIPSGTTPSAP